MKLATTASVGRQGVGVDSRSAACLPTSACAYAVWRPRNPPKPNDGKMRNTARKKRGTLTGGAWELEARKSRDVDATAQICSEPNRRPLSSVLRCSTT